MLYVEITADGTSRHLQYAPYLDYRPLDAEEPSAEAVLARPELQWITHDLEARALGYAIENVVPEHLNEVRGRRLGIIAKVRAAVKDRLTKEIHHWDHRAEELRLREQTGTVNARLNSQEARRRADALQARLEKRLKQLDEESQIAALPPRALGAVVVVPLGLLAKISGGRAEPERPENKETQVAAAAARAAVMEVERRLGFEPVDREFDKVGYDVESRDPITGRLRFIEVKGRVSGAPTITVTRNEILYSLNKPENFILAIVEFMPDGRRLVHHVREPFQREPDFGVTSVNYDFPKLLARAEFLGSA